MAARDGMNQSITVGRLAVRWFLGGVVGTCLIAFSSPWFVRSYQPLVVDPIRKTWVLPPNAHYRWRSEGYAETQIGPLGMPGRTQSLQINANPTPSSSSKPLRIAPQPLRIALWGDSQVEGVCVADADKLFATMERLSEGRAKVFPLARSGEDAADWLSQIPHVEDYLGIELHLFLIADLEDLLSAPNAPLASPDETDVKAANSAIASRYPAFLIQAARNLLMENGGSNRRSLRFGLGPVDSASPASKHSPEAEATLGSERLARWNDSISSIRQSTGKPIWIFNAPVAPQIIDGRIVQTTQSHLDLDAMQNAASTHQIFYLSARADFAHAVGEGCWPHGFHNGRIGSGHLNAEGNRILAERLIRELLDRDLIREGRSEEKLDKEPSRNGDLLDRGASVLGEHPSLSKPSPLRVNRQRGMPSDLSSRTRFVEG